MGHCCRDKVGWLERVASDLAHRALPQWPDPYRRTTRSQHREARADARVLQRTPGSLPTA